MMWLCWNTNIVMNVHVSYNHDIIECIEGDVKLIGGRNEYEARVEVCDGGEWKTVCDRMWCEDEAMVVGRQLNYSDPLSK